jgi:hypothetical protein
VNKEDWLTDEQFTLVTCVEIAEAGVDILYRGGYSCLQLEDMTEDLEAITDGRMQVREEEVPQRD